MRGVLTISSEWTTLRRSKRPPMCYDSRRRRARRRSQADAALVQERHPGLELRGQVNRREASHPSPMMNRSYVSFMRVSPHPESLASDENEVAIGAACQPPRLQSGLRCRSRNRERTQGTR